jgi:penicillin-binding protein 1C
MEVVTAARHQALARIAYPAEGTVIALDPDIPPSRQRVALQLSAPAAAGWRWQLGETTLGRADRPMTWLPQPGKHRLRLVDAQGRELGIVGFEVRALPAARPR